ncbi:Transcriptional regulatory protein ZraR [Rosistilla carotiformis]|uniref:Transcriptional regulatory protein ZraR n=1 Tax=Rosistilla carotiformis TaxID=2528017 RepID=A0A518JXW1_9BACT|nr:sigma-54 dependent transcriptional regulator [Rosistilla carotiformis]QDV70380.1 Transcriptional regulatory protein ZraR [Rosistilla carotiformis]
MNVLAFERDAIAVLWVDTDGWGAAAAKRCLGDCGYHVGEVESVTAALQAARSQRFDVAVVGLPRIDQHSLELLGRLHATAKSMRVLVVVDEATVATAVSAMKVGVSDVLVKPVGDGDLERVIQASAEDAKVSSCAADPPSGGASRAGRSSILGTSVAIGTVLQWIDRVAPSAMPVLIEGESGTGKELVAREIHAASRVADQPMVAINCAAVPASLLESELFGHEQGSFTGAIASKRGLFEMADGGTLFIDEFGELAGGLQAKLLRAIEDGRIRRVGATEERQVRVRLVAATNKTLSDEVRAGRFREDLFYRINVLGIRLPSLREHPEDIGLLVKHFLGDSWTLGEGVLKALQQYAWPGNVRQLCNALERSKVLAAQPGIIAIEDLPREIVTAGGEPPLEIGGNVDLETLNRVHVLKVLKQHRGNKAKTSRVLGINRRSLYRLLEKFGSKHGG